MNKNVAHFIIWSEKYMEHIVELSSSNWILWYKYVPGPIFHRKWYLCHSKNIPTQLREVILNRGGAAYYNHGDIVMVKYGGNKDSSRGQPKISYVLSTGHSAGLGNTTKKERDGNIV